MYYRIMNRLDADALSTKICKDNVEEKIVADRINELIEILDDAYGEHRNSYAMGGFIFYFPDEDTYEREYANILEFYHLNASDYEYSDLIGNAAIQEKEWREELFMLSSDDSLVFIHPKEVIKNGI